MSLPTYAEMKKNTLGYLNGARDNLSSARDELNSDWSADAPPTDAQRGALAEVRTLVRDAKAMIDQAKRVLDEQE